MRRTTGWVRIVTAFVVGSCSSLMSLAATSPVYVDDNWTGSTNCGGHTWGVDAFNNIQAAVDNVTKGGIVWVNDGIYNTNGKKWGGSSNRVAMTQKMTVRSVNGPLTTIIEGVADPVATNGNLAMRCVYMTNNTTLVGFTLRSGHTKVSDTWNEWSKHSGGGVLLDQGGTVSNCVIQGCTAYRNGGGALCNNGGTVANSLIEGNEALNAGGGVYFYLNGTLRSTTIAGNMNRGLYVYEGGSAQNCIIYFNTVANVKGANDATFNNCCSTPLLGGSDNIDADPMFVDMANGNYQLQGPSPCLNKGLYQSWMTNNTDLAGNPRVVGTAVDIGAYEVGPAVFVDDNWTGPTNCGGRTWGVNAFNVIQTAVDAVANGGTVWVYDGFYNQGGAYMYGSNRVVLAKPITLQSVSGPANALIVGESNQLVRGVYMTNGAVLAGFTVTNGYAQLLDTDHLFASGAGILMNQGGLVTNCLVTRCQLHRQSEAFGNGICCSGGTISRSTIERNGYMEGNSAFGGGIYCESGKVLDCTVQNNVGARGAGVFLWYDATMERSVVSQNYGGFESVMVCANSTVCDSSISSNQTGSGVEVMIGSAVIANCSIVCNAGYGLCTSEGAWVVGCLIANNARTGIDALDTYVYNSTIVGNNYEKLGLAGGVHMMGSVLRNSIVYNNYAPINSAVSNCSSAVFLTVENSCTTPLPSGTGNIDADPLFVNAANGNYRLQSGSPCIDTGMNESWMVYDYDLDGNPRLIDGNGDSTATVDMGAYEFLPTP